ncbi:MAG: hypothetical protein KGM16_11960 [Bacteroidota bacterium]|nr:hypothetical protein [Bacteroidota bacterium]
MKIAILTRPDNRSPRVLADSLKLQLEDEKVYVEVFYKIDILTRLVAQKESKLSFYFWLKKKINHFLKDRELVKKLKRFDAVFISECSPNGFWKRLYNVEKFRKLLRKPVLLYEVYYLGNAPTQIDILSSNGDTLVDRYDFHLSVSDVTEIKQPSSDIYFPIGLYAKSWNLMPAVNEEIIAILDFVQPGYEEHRKLQTEALKKVGIKYISLEGSYTIEEIRNIYRQGSIYFMQSSEAFGLPVLECLCCGCQVFTPFSWWPMSWRLDKEPTVHGDGILPECFTVYKNEAQLVDQLIQFKSNYRPGISAEKVFQSLLSNYPSFYYGNRNQLQRLLTNLENYKNNLN